MPKYNFEVPKILECCKFSVPFPTSSYTPSERIVKNYEIDYNISGKRTMRIDGEYYSITDGSIVCRRPGQQAASMGVFNMYMMTLDFSRSANPENKIRQHSNNRMQPEYDSYIWNIIPTCFEPRHSSEIFAMYKKLAVLSRQPERSYETDCTLMSLLHLIIADACLLNISNNTEETPTDKLLEYMQNNYRNKITLDDLANYIHMNKSYLIRLFKRETGKTPIDYLINLRLSQAKKMLLNSGYPINEISSACGFENTAYFISRFRREFAITPENYRLNVKR